MATVRTSSTYVIPATVIPQGDGSVIVKPGRPVDRITPLEFAKRVGLSRNSVYRYIGSDALPERFVIFAGRHKILIQAEAVAHFLETCAAQRGSGA